MANLILFRHAKSRWSDVSLDDFDRPLNNRGRKAAAVMGKEIMNRFGAPDRVLCSAARRTVETWERAAEAFPEGVIVDRRTDLYHAPAERMLEIVRSVEKDAAYVLVIGHNPGLQRLALDLVGEAPDAESIAEKFPTAAVAAFNVNAPWDALSVDAARLEAFLKPRDFTAS